MKWNIWFSCFLRIISLPFWKLSTHLGSLSPWCWWEVSQVREEDNWERGERERDHTVLLIQLLHERHFGMECFVQSSWPQAVVLMENQRTLKRHVFPPKLLPSTNKSFISYFIEYRHKKRKFWKIIWNYLSVPAILRAGLLISVFFLFFKKAIFKNVLVSAVQQCESAIIIHIFPPFPPPSHPSRSSQRTRLVSWKKGFL